MPFIALYIRSSILYAIHCLIGSQGNWQSTGVIHVCSELWVLDTRWVAQFWTYCSLSRTDHVNPYRSALQGHLPVLSVLGVGHLQILHCPRAGHSPTPGPFPRFWLACAAGGIVYCVILVLAAEPLYQSSESWRRSRHERRSREKYLFQTYFNTYFKRLVPTPFFWIAAPPPKL